MGQDVAQVSPTFGFRIHTLPRPPYSLHLWDIGGQKSIRAYWRNYYEETDGLVFVIDAAAPHRLEESLGELRGLMAQDRLAGASLLIIANKQDCRGALTLGQIETCLRGLGLGGGETMEEAGAVPGSAIRGHCRVFATSALRGENVQEALDWLVSDVAARLYHCPQGGTGC